MAHISITVEQATGLYTISLDVWEWQSLSIWENGAWVDMPLYEGPNKEIKFLYEQKAPVGPVQFKIVANEYVGTAIPATMLLLKDPIIKDKTYFAGIMYTNPGSEVHLLGILTTNYEALPGALDGPLHFSQTHMTGTFAVNS